MKHHPSRRPPASAKQQRGLVLVIALILMAVIGISSSAAIRMALTSNAVALGLKAGNEAMQRAEIALRWCEIQTRLRYLGSGGTDSVNFYLVPASEEAVSAAMANDYTLYMANSRPVPANILTAAGLAPGNQPPQCLCQQMPLTGTSSDEKDYTGASSSTPLYGSFVLTVRASSNDFRETTGGTDAGSEVWLRSSLLIALHP